MASTGEVQVHIEGAPAPDPVVTVPLTTEPLATAPAAAAPAPVAQPAPTPAPDHQGASAQPAVAMAADNKSAGSAGAAADKANAAIVDNKTVQAASHFLSPGFTEPFFGCFSSVPGCLLSCCCPCFVAAANEANVAGRPVTVVDCLFCCPQPYTTRQTLRKKYNMGWAPFNDCLAVCCCTCCFLHQQTREIARLSGQPPEYFKMI